MTGVLLAWTTAAPDETARALGFALAPGSGGSWTRGGFVLDTGPGWLELRRAEPCSGDPLRDALGLRGLWRALPSRRDPERTDWVFDLPALSPPPTGDATPGEHPAAPLVDWAERLERDAPGDGPPPRDEVEAWIAASDCSVHAGDALVQIEPILEAERFGLAIPELVRAPAALPPARAAWLAELCRSAQVHWHLVRIGVDGPRVRAEVDLTDAPAALCRPLFDLALAALRQSAAWVLPGLELTTDRRNPSVVVDHHPRWAHAPRPQGEPA